MRALVLSIALLLAGCYDPHVNNGELQCSLGGGKCPVGFHCAFDGTCWRNGQDPGVATVPDMADSGPAAGRQAGDACSAATQCGSGFCSPDGVCCDRACTGGCEACNLPATPGVCTNVPAGAMPAMGHDSCGPDAKSSCKRDGTCDGKGGCALWQNVVCKPASCDATANKATAASKCDGQGTCVTPNAVICDPYLCLGDVCAPSCGPGAGQCKPPATCSNNSCGTKPNGSACTQPTDCTTGNCVDGVCCDTACSGKCEACDVSPNLGTCSGLAMGQPHGARGNCAGFGTACAGACTISSRTACGNFPGASGVPNVTCAAQSCQNSTTQLNAAQCDGAGACSPQTTTSCGAYLCSGTACAGSCTGDQDCSAGAPYCNGSTCLTTKPPGRTCTAAGQCTSNACVDGYCCSSSCTGACQRCDATPGTCTNVAAGGQPVDGRAACTGSGTPCAGSCDGNGACGNYPGSTTTCTLPAGGAGACNGMGTCVASGCFAAGTLVDTSEGPRPIEQIVSGDLVRSYDTDGGQPLWRRVSELQVKHTRWFVALLLSDGSRVLPTPEHYFWVRGSGWVRAFELQPDDELMTAGPAPVRVASIASVNAGPNLSLGEVEVFNLVVEQENDYFVGGAGVLVISCDHNFTSLDPSELPR